MRSLRRASSQLKKTMLVSAGLLGMGTYISLKAKMSEKRQKQPKSNRTYPNTSPLQKLNKQYNYPHKRSILLSPEKLSKKNTNEFYINTGSAFLSGASAGAFVAYGTFPAESFKKYAQRNKLGIRELTNREYMLKLLKSDPFPPFRGSLTFAINIIPTTAVQLATDQALKYVMPQDAGTTAQAAASAFCGVMGATTATPIENFVARMQVLGKEASLLAKQNNTKNQKIPASKVFSDLFKRGITRPWKSYPYIAIRDANFTFCMLWLNPKALIKAKEMFGDNPFVDLSVKIAVSITGATAGHWADTVGTYMQVSHQKVSGRQIMQTIIKSSGALALFNGLPARLLLFFAFSNIIPYVQKQTDPTARKLIEATVSKLGFFKRTENDAHFDEHPEPSNSEKSNKVA